MTDWADGTEERNYGIRADLQAGSLPELLRNIGPIALIAGALLFCSWVRSEIVAAGYEYQELSAVEDALLRAEKRLILEEETLLNPERIDLVARNELGMAPLRPNQLVLPVVQDAGLAHTMALLDSEAAKPNMIASRAVEFVPSNSMSRE